MGTPSTVIFICSGVPLNNRYDHTLYFPNALDQQTYFRSKVVKQYNAYTFVRRSWKLKVESDMDTARTWSYLYFRNGTSKYYYYFINQIEYINDATVELTLELDVMQTYQFEWVLHPCYVERQHTTTDNPGENTVDEGLDVGEYITRGEDVAGLNELGVMVAATMDINKFYVSGGETVDNILGAKIDRLYGGFQVTMTDLDTNWDELSVLLNFLNEKGKIDTIFTMWVYPKRLVNYNNGTFEDGIFTKYVSGSKSVEVTATMNTPTSIDGYTPKNKKVLQYPYCYMYASNHNGGAAIYQYHHFSDTMPRFRVIGCIAPDAVVKLTPLNYKGSIINREEALALGNFPICSWNSDTYKLWLAQNQNQMNMGYAMAGLKIAGGVASAVTGVMATGATGGAAAGVGLAGASAGVSMISSGLTDIAGQLAQKADKEIQPPQARGTFSGSYNVCEGLQDFRIIHKTIDKQHAQIIDSFFTLYGYACRRVVMPNIHARSLFTYVKTVGSNVTGDFCVEDVKRINEIFDKGVTFWTDPAKVGGYHDNNLPLGG